MLLEEVLWSEPVLHKNEYDINLGDKHVEVVVVELRESRLKEESTTMKVDQDGKFLDLIVVLLLGVGEFWKKKTSGNGGIV